MFNSWKTRAQELGEPWIGSSKDLAAALRAKGVPVGLHIRLRMAFCAGLRKKRAVDEQQEAAADAATDAERAQTRRNRRKISRRTRRCRRELDMEDFRAGPPFGKDEDED